jgi:hypothetical protein
MPGALILVVLLLVSGVASVASALLRMWINETDLPEAKPRCALFTATVFPWACIAWVLWVAGFWSAANPGGGSHCKFSNGYEIEMIDVLDMALLRELKGARTEIDGVRTLQIAGPYFAGARNIEPELTPKDAAPDVWFLLDTRNRKMTVFQNAETLREAAAAVGFTLELKPVAEIYDQQGWTAIDTMMRYLLFIPPQLAFGFLLWWLQRLRQDARLALAAEEAFEPAEEAAAG